MLAKIENKQFCSSARIRFNQIVNDLVEDWEDIFAYKDVEVIIHEIAPSNPVSMDKGLAITLVQNLLKNAIAHNIPQGKVIIDVSANSFQSAIQVHQRLL